MRSSESLIFISTRILYLLFILAAWIMLQSNSEGEFVLTYFILGIIGVVIAFALSKQYDAGSTTARSWMLLANFAGIFVFISDMQDMAKLASRSRYEFLGNLGVLIDIICLMGTILILIKMQKKIKLTPAPAVNEPAGQPNTDPETKLQQLKSMLENELITPGEYEQKKQEILGKM